MLKKFFPILILSSIYLITLSEGNISITNNMKDHTASSLNRSIPVNFVLTKSNEIKKVLAACSLDAQANFETFVSMIEKDIFQDEELCNLIVKFTQLKNPYKNGEELPTIILSFTTEEETLNEKLDSIEIDDIKRSFSEDELTEFAKIQEELSKKLSSFSEKFDLIPNQPFAQEIKQKENNKKFLVELKIA